MSEGIAPRLRAAARSMAGDRVHVHELLAAHGTAASGSLLLLLAVPSLLPLPGTGTAFGLGLVAVSVAMCRSLDVPRLPKRLMTLKLPADSARRVLLILAAVYEWAARWLKARLALVVNGQARWLIAPTIGAMGAVLVLPIPFGNILPGLSLVAIGLGLVFKDGLALIAGTVLAVGTLALLGLAGHWLLW